MGKKFNMADLLNNKSKEKMESAIDSFEIKQIPIEKIVPSHKNKYGIRDIEELAANMEMIGLMHNIVVSKNDSNMYEIISGERRYTAIKKLYEEGNDKWKTIPCKIEQSKDTLIKELELLFANSTARELTDYEKTYQAARIKEILIDLKKNGYKFTGRMREMVAEMLKVSSSQIGRMESINDKLTPELKEVFKKDEINITTAYEISRLPEEKQEKALEEIKEKGEISIKKVKELQGEDFNSKKVKEDIKTTELNLIKEIDKERTIRSLKELIKNIESGNCWTIIDIKRVCLEAVILLERGK